MEDRWLVVANPEAGNGKVKKRLTEIKKALDHHLSGYQLVLTDGPGSGIELTKKAILDGHRKIIAIGGDGTSNEVVNGIFTQNQVSTTAITYALLPVGTGNDWIKMHQIPRDLNQWIAMVKNGKTVLQDIGLVTYQKENREQASRYFANVAGMAYDAFVVKYSLSYRSWITNKLFYLYLIIHCLFKYDLVKAKVLFNDQLIEDRFYTINIGVCKYSGGGLSLVPHADPFDGKLALTIAGKISKVGVLLNTYRFYDGSVGKHPKIQTFQVDKLKVEAGEETPTLLEVDGEFLGQTPAAFSLIPASLKVIVP